MIALENLLSSHPQVILPIVLVLIGLTYRVVVDQEVTRLDILSTIVVLPLEMKLLALSFFASYAISNPQNATTGSMLLFAFTFTAIFTTLVWKKAQKLYEKSSYFWCGLLTIANGTFSYLVAEFAISKLTGVNP
jgi:hypothetical protein